MGSWLNSFGILVKPRRQSVGSPDDDSAERAEMAGLGQAGHSPGRLTVAAYLRGIGSSAPTSPSGDAHQARTGSDAQRQWPRPGYAPQPSRSSDEAGAEPGRSVALREGAGPVPVRAPRSRALPLVKRTPTLIVSPDELGVGVAASAVTSTSRFEGSRPWILVSSAARAAPPSAVPPPAL